MTRVERRVSTESLEQVRIGDEQPAECDRVGAAFGEGLCSAVACQKPLAAMIGPLNRCRKVAAASWFDSRRRPGLSLAIQLV